MEPLFNIRPTHINFSTAHLFVEIGEHGFYIFILDDTNTFSAVCIYQFPDKLNTENNISDILYNDPLLKQAYRKIDILHSFTESVLTPKELAGSDVNKNILDLVYGDFPDKVIRGDFMYKHNIQNIYRVPKAVDTIINNFFSTANVTHSYSVLPDLVSGVGNNLYAVFCPHHIIIMLVKQGKLQVIQKFAYQSAEDASYHLLNVCTNFDSAVNDTQLILSGLIDERSNLYKELYKYFTNIEFSSLPDKFNYTDEIKKHPQHFFSHLFGIAACV